MSERPSIPAGLVRQLMIDAGWKCSIPMCGVNTDLEVEHIEEWSTVREHVYENLIVLCPTHHRMKKTGSNPRQVNAHALKIVKQNQLELVGRYSDIERRVLEHFQRNPDERVVLLPGDFDILLMHLLDAGVLEKDFQAEGAVGVKIAEGDPSVENMLLLRQGYRLTDSGVESVQALRHARALH